MAITGTGFLACDDCGCAADMIANVIPANPPTHNPVQEMALCTICKDSRREDGQSVIVTENLHG